MGCAMNKQWFGWMLLAALAGCGTDSPPPPAPAPAAPVAAAAPAAPSYAEQHLAQLATVRLDADLAALNADERKLLALLIEAAQLMDELFWQQTWGERDALLAKVADPSARRLVEINYGPWDRLNGDQPFVEGIGPKPPGAQFYPADMTKPEFEQAALPGKDGLYTLLRRDAQGALAVVPYHQAYAATLERAAAKLRDAAKLAQDEGFRRYLELRAEALLDDDYQPSDLAWMDMKTNAFDLVIGPIETYEDALFGYKAAYEAYVLIKDREWSDRLQRYAAFLPELQKGLPVPDAYKAEQAGSNADLNAYQVVYYAGHANSGGKTIAINLPNDEQVQLAKGSRRLQLKNAMQAKFEKILQPIAATLIAADQQQHITFDAFFQNVMFHEVAHGLGIKNTLDGKGTVRAALKDQASSLEEGKADILGLYMVTQLAEKGELPKEKLMDNYVTFLAGIIRSVRFGASDAHGIANMICFNFFESMHAFERGADGRYRVDFDKTRAAMDALSRTLLTIQGDGDYAAAQRLSAEQGVIGAVLASDLKRLESANIPVDVIFEQGLEVLGLQPSAPAAAAAP
jgi:hypothetical protein